jgi:hypothetical protein
MPSLEAFVKELYARINGGEIEAFAQLVSRASDVLGIGTDPAEWWDGPTALCHAFETQVREMHAAGMQLESSGIHVVQLGTVGWCADRPMLVLPNGERLATRVTLVCQQEDGVWRLIHWHISVGVANEAAVGQELTIA